MINKIQLRGISHSPSDRGTMDGGLEDCIDLRMIEQEQAPATAPEDITDEIATGLSSSGIDVIYIHKTNSFTNYIGVKETGGHKYIYAYHNPDGSWTSQQIVQLPDDEYPKGISSVGNIVVASIEGESLYLLYRDGEYKFLGDSIPRPTVTFVTSAFQNDSEEKRVSSALMVNAYLVETGAQDVPTPYEFWNYIESRRYSDDEVGSMAAEFYAEVYNSLWNFVAAKRKENLGDNTFSAPVLVRYAVRLYDGSYVHISEPILLGGRANQHTRLAANLDSSGYNFVLLMQLVSNFATKIYIDYDPGLWSELIESVDVFLSQDILAPDMNAELMRARQLDTRFSDPDLAFNNDNIEIRLVGEGESVENFEEEMLEASNFYRVASYNLGNLPDDEYLRPKSQDELVVGPRLEEGDAHDISMIGNLGTYNNRFISGSQVVTLSPGHNDPQALSLEAGGTDKYYRIYYHVRDNDGGEHLVKGYSEDAFPDNYAKAYVAYPDAKCYQADLYIGSSSSSFTTKVILPMKEHPRLNVAYGFWGLNKILDTPDSDDRSTEVVTGLPDENSLNPTYEIDNRLMMSEMDNPFIFPLGQRIPFSARIIAIAPVTTALSAGQFGQFPLYTFTGDGIYSVSINDEGEIVASHPVSRDVAVEGTIAQLDQAIVFVSDQGVMMLSGSQIVNLSPNMQGHQFTIGDITPAAVNSALQTALTGDGWGSLLNLHLDTTDFQDFVAASRPLYDYGRKRILFFNPSKGYAYDYALDTQTWSKVSVPAGTTFQRNLNGYPDALAVFSGSIFDWSVQPDYNAASPTSRKGILVTRPFDLGVPDVRKAIKSIRIRGQYNHADVKYILLGSMNGVQWTRLMSLRGGSYKSFRLVLLTELIPDERISWVDIDFEPRFGDKLR